MLEKMFEFVAKSGLFKPILSLFMLSAVILILPNLAILFGMQDNFINEYKNITVLIFIYSFFMILFTLIHEFYKLCIRLYVNHRDSDKQVALRYLKKSLTPDQQKFIDEKFFDKENNKYHQFAKIERLDGRGKELERNKVVEITDANIDIYQHSYNLLSYSLEFFNQKKENKK